MRIVLLLIVTMVVLILYMKANKPSATGQSRQQAVQKELDSIQEKMQKRLQGAMPKKDKACDTENDLKKMEQELLKNPNPKSLQGKKPGCDTSETNK